jgi:5-methylcytosine-specific restriction endonuclease McrA
MSSPGQLRRDEIIERDKSTCYLCKKVFDSSELVIDHIIPTSRGGTNATFNLAAACAPCDKRKNDYLLSELEWVSNETKAKYSTLKRERVERGKRIAAFFKRVELAILVLLVTPEHKLESLIAAAKRK